MGKIFCDKMDTLNHSKTFKDKRLQLGFRTPISNLNTELLVHTVVVQYGDVGSAVVSYDSSVVRLYPQQEIFVSFKSQLVF